MSEKNLPAIRPQLTVETWNMIESVAVAAYESRKVGVATRGEAALKFLFCYENGLPLSTANTGLYIVNGRLAAQSHIVAAQLRKHPSYDYRIKSLDDKGCTVEIMRLNGESEWVVEGSASFTEEDAKRANLLGKENYQGYPSDMYFNRALARAQRRYAPDVFSQPVYTPEELGMRVDAEGDVIDGSWREVAQAPKAAPKVEAPQADALQQLLTDFPAEAVLAANDGQIPTVEQIETVRAKLLAERDIEV